MRYCVRILQVVNTKSWNRRLKHCMLKSNWLNWVLLEPLHENLSVCALCGAVCAERFVRSVSGEIGNGCGSKCEGKQTQKEDDIKHAGRGTCSLDQIEVEDECLASRSAKRCLSCCAPRPDVGLRCCEKAHFVLSHAPAFIDEMVIESSEDTTKN